jgi:hypothetical protein
MTGQQKKGPETVESSTAPVLRSTEPKIAENNADNTTGNALAMKRPNDAVKAPFGRNTECPDIGTFPVSREMEPYEGAGDRSSLILLRKRFYADVNRQLTRLLASAETLEQKGENLFLN